MRSHIEYELLAAFFAGEIEGEPRASIEAHIETCDECHGRLDALRATVNELRALGEADVPTDARAALHARINAERRRQPRYARFVMAAGTAAAAVVAIVAIRVSDRIEVPSVTNVTSDASTPLSGPSVIALGGDFDEQSARSLLFSQTSPTGESAGAFTGVPVPAAGAPAASADDTAVPGSSEGQAPAAAERGAAQGQTAPIDRSRASECARQMQQGADEPSNVSTIYAARFKGTPAFFIVLEIPASDPERLELWVTSTTTCDVLFWAQRSLR